MRTISGRNESWKNVASNCGRRYIERRMHIGAVPKRSSGKLGKQLSGVEPDGSEDIGCIFPTRQPVPDGRNRVQLQSAKQQEGAVQAPPFEHRCPDIRREPFPKISGVKTFRERLREQGLGTQVQVHLGTERYPDAKQRERVVDYVTRFRRIPLQVWHFCKKLLHRVSQWL